MKSIGIITFHESINYGAILQSYALQKILEKMGYAPEIIDYCNPKRSTATLCLYRRILHHIWRRVVTKLLVGSKRKRKTEEFREKNLRLSEQKYYDMILLHAAPPMYDAYITGSDQVWNPRNNNNDSSYFLTFAPDGKRRISYAASFGVAEIKNGVKENYAEWLKQINHISVRESEGVQIVKKLIGTDAELVLDPTLLLDKDHWDQIAIPYKKSSPYILCYYMPGDKLVSRSITKIAKNVASMYGWRVINIGEKEYMRLNPFRRSIFTAGPAEFVGLFHNASFVITNSYHGTAFAITYRIPFLVPINAHLPPQKALSSRITSLLKAFELDRRIIRAEDGLPEEIDIDLDYAPIEQKIELDRKKSAGFINEALRD